VTSRFDAANSIGKRSSLRPCVVAPTKRRDSYWREVAVRYDMRRKWSGPGIIDAKGSNYDGNHSLRR
jgi:hypothetical protein